MSKTITSDSNPQYQLWKSLLEGRGVKKSGLFLLAGRKTVPEWVGDSRLQSPHLILPENSEAEFEVPQELPKTYLAKNLFKELDQYGTHSPLLVAQQPEIVVAEEIPPPKALEIILPLGDPGNLGGALRTAVATGVEKIYLTEESANPYHSKSLRASSGTALSAPIYKTRSIKNLKLSTDLENILYLSTTGTSLKEFEWPKKSLLILGEEGPGFEDTRLKAISIPIKNEAESLNALSAMSMALFSYRLKYPL